MWLLISFLALPVAELITMIQVALAIGTLPMLGLLLLSGVAGFALIRQGGLHSMAEMQRMMRDMRNPSTAMTRGGFWMAAGVLLIVPGFLTDIMAVLLLLPPVQQAVLRRVKIVSSVSGQFSDQGPQPRRDADIIDGEFQEIEPEAPQLGGTSGWTRH